MTKKTNGFTLIELMIVVAIIAIIAAIAIPSLVRSRMAANQTAATAACKAYSEAQEIYRRSDYDHDGVLEYAQALKGNNSLLESATGANDLALIDKTFAGAEGDPGSGVPPKAGYVFKILTSQGVSATGGSQNYLVGTNMTLGYGMSAVPAAYEGTGTSQFLISHNGTVFQKDTGNNTHMTIFGPDSSWAPSE